MVNLGLNTLNVFMWFSVFLIWIKSPLASECTSILTLWEWEGSYYLLRRPGLLSQGFLLISNCQEWKPGFFNGNRTVDRESLKTTGVADCPVLGHDAVFRTSWDWIWGHTASMGRHVARNHDIYYIIPQLIIWLLFKFCTPKNFKLLVFL